MKNVISNKKTDTVILALLEHGSIEKAAAALGVWDVTLWRWLKKPLVAEAYRIAKREAFARSIGRLQHAASAAVSTLLRVMLDKDASASRRSHSETFVEVVRAHRVVAN